MNTMTTGKSCCFRDRRDKDRDRDRRDRDRERGRSGRDDKGDRKRKSYFEKPVDEV